MATEQERYRTSHPDLGPSVNPLVNAALAEIAQVQARANAELRAVLEKQFNAPMDDPALRSTTTGRLDGRRI